MLSQKIRDYLGELVNAQLENRTPSVIPEGISPEMIEKLAVQNQMVYLLLGGLLKIDLPQEYTERFREKVFKSTLKTLAQVYDANLLSREFENAGIRHQVLKGTVLKQLYPTPELREMGDIDIMIYEESFDKAEEILSGMEYQKLQAVKHHVIFKKPPFLVVEAHWSLYEKSVDKVQYLYYQDNFRAELSEGKKYTYEFTKEDFYVYMISHMAKHFYENGCGIRNLVDVYVYLKKYDAEMNHKEITKQLKQLGIADFEENIRVLAMEWLDKRKLSSFSEKLFDYMAECGTYGKEENGIFSQYAKDAADEKSMKVWYYFPKYAHMKELYPWLGRFPWLLPVAWGIRGVSAFSDKKRRKRRKAVSEMGNDHIAETQEIYKKMKLNFYK